ncbi:MAG: thioredoxin family protein [Bacteroidota bacterium]|nr:thioredoxin family protein [Bacteroidota bacterium]
MLLVSLLALVACDDDSAGPDSDTNPGQATVTFLEIGMDHCEPCLLMRPVMASLAERYGEQQLAVIFLDVIKDKAKVDPYKIRVMPTQVFLDHQGAEFHRHEGFYPEEEIDSLLATRGLTPSRPPAPPPRRRGR